MNKALTPVSAGSLERISQTELQQIIKKHRDFLRGVRGGARAVLKFKDMSGLDFKGADLSQADFTGSLLHKANLSGGTFKGVSFFACDLRQARLENADFTRADFRGAHVAGADLTGADLASADLREGKVMEKDDKGVLADRPQTGRKKYEQQKTIFSGAKLRETNLSGSRASAADFSDADMTGVVIKNADFSGANFTGANLTDANLSGSNLSGANVRSSIMSGAVLHMVETGGTNLKEALTADNQEEARAIEQSLPELLEAHTAWVATAGQQGERLDLSGYDLRHIGNLRSYPLTAIKATGAIFLQQDLHKAEMQSALLDRADFRDCNLAGADLRGSSLKEAQLSRANLSEANFAPLQFTSENGVNWLQRADLSGANLRYAILRGAVLADAILTGVDLSYAVLIDCDLRRADLSDAILNGTDMTDCRTAGAIIDEKYR